MHPSIERRISELESWLVPEEQFLVVIPRKGESRDDMEARVEAWKRGEPGTGLSDSMGKPYLGGGLIVRYVTIIPDQVTA